MMEDNEKNEFEKEETSGQNEENRQSVPYEYEESAGESATENVPPYHAPQAGAPKADTGSAGFPDSTSYSGTQPAQPNNTVPPYGVNPGAGNVPGGQNGYWQGQQVPPQQTQWTFNDYGPIGGQKPPKPPKPPKTKAPKEKKPKSPGNGGGFKVLAIVMSVLFVLTAVGMGSYIAYDLTQKPESNQAAQSSASSRFQIEDSPAVQPDNPSSSQAVTGQKLTGSQIYDAVEPAVVGVVGYVKANTGMYQVASQGSGVVFTADGYIVTNRHVIKNETTDQNFEKVEVIRTTGETYVAQVVGSDKETDLAVLKVEGSGMTTVSFGDSDQLKVGDQAFVIGNPSGLEYAGSLAGGYISAVNREVYMQSIGAKVELIQTDAAINPGNSGGALVNEYGQLVGITSAKLVGEDYEGMGFAIPINNAKPIIESLINNGYVAGRVQIGLTYSPVSKTLADLNGIPQGLRVVSINEDSDALAKGLQVGDIIYKMDGTEVYDTPEVKKALQNKKPGDTIVLSVYRVGLDEKAQKLEITVTLKEKVSVEE